mmetsp:Transcript_116668/g.212230  ORF Transcript_116668/g.212230 Transcript_116668/m.212230 type:complete len:337 (+) Transcript_116668:67-1077(+)
MHMSETAENKDLGKSHLRCDYVPAGSGLPNCGSTLWRLGNFLQTRSDTGRSCPLGEELLPFLDPGGHSDSAETASEKSRKKDDGHKAKKGARCDLASLEQGGLDFLASCMMVFGKQMQVLEQTQKRQCDSAAADAAKFLRNLEAVEKLCRDTATMGMQHAQAVLRMGLRMDVLERQVALLWDEQAPSEFSTRSATLVEPCNTPANAFAAPDVQACNPTSDVADSVGANSDSHQPPAELSRCSSTPLLPEAGTALKIQESSEISGQAFGTQMSDLIQRVAKLEGLVRLAPLGDTLAAPRQISQSPAQTTRPQVHSLQTTRLNHLPRLLVRLKGSQME